MIQTSLDWLHGDCLDIERSTPGCDSGGGDAGDGGSFDGAGYDDDESGGGLNVADGDDDGGDVVVAIVAAGMQSRRQAMRLQKRRLHCSSYFYGCSSLQTKDKELGHYK